MDQKKNLLGEKNENIEFTKFIDLAQCHRELH